MQWSRGFELLTLTVLSFCLARSCTPKSESLPLRRWPCWPGPYSRLLTGLLGRPQIFWPIRRSILYCASLRLVIASSLLHSHGDCDGVLIARNLRRRALLCAGKFPV